MKTYTKFGAPQFLGLVALGMATAACANAGTKSSSAHPTMDKQGVAWRAISSDQVRTVQTALNDKMGAGLSVDGVMGTRTKQAIRDFQSQNDLAVTGALDSDTLNALDITSDFQRAPASVPTHPLGEPFEP